MMVNGVHIDLSKQTVGEAARAAGVSISTLIRLIREQASVDAAKDAQSQLRRKYAWEMRSIADKKAVPE